MQGTPYPCLLGGRLHKVYRDDVQNAMREFDAKRATEPVTGRKYFLWFKGTQYPPKRILSSVTSVPAYKFSGGDPTNQVFRDLGFVVATPKRQRELKRRRLGSEPPSAKTLVRKLFRERWSPLVRNFRGTTSGKYPGVYVLAFSDKNSHWKTDPREQHFLCWNEQRQPEHQAEPVSQWAAQRCNSVPQQMETFEGNVFLCCCSDRPVRDRERLQD